MGKRSRKKKDSLVDADTVIDLDAQREARRRQLREAAAESRRRRGVPDNDRSGYDYYGDPAGTKTSVLEEEKTADGEIKGEHVLARAACRCQRQRIAGDAAAVIRRIPFAERADQRRQLIERHDAHALREADAAGRVGACSGRRGGLVLRVVGNLHAAALANCRGQRNTVLRLPHPPVRIAHDRVILRGDRRIAAVDGDGIRAVIRIRHLHAAERGGVFLPRQRRCERGCLRRRGDAQQLADSRTSTRAVVSVAPNNAASVAGGRMTPSEYMPQSASTARISTTDKSSVTPRAL